jgi:hypothetical protein
MRRSSTNGSVTLVEDVSESFSNAIAFACENALNTAAGNHGCCSEFAAHADKMHDREDAGALKIILGGRDRIEKQPADMGMTALERRRHTRRNDAIDLTHSG